MKIYNWRDLNLRSCDILLASGTGSLSKKIILFNKLTGVKGTAAQLSHGALFVDIFFPPEVFESTTLNKWADKRGVQKNFFDEWLYNYKGRVWVRKQDFERTLEFQNKYYSFIRKHLGDAYESGIAGYAELLLAGLQWDRFVREIWPSYRPISTLNPHCTELMVEAMQYLTLMTAKAIPSRMPPSTLWTGGAIEKYLIAPISEPIPIK